ncbi:MAG: amidase, partial [Patescibacteria group bacterium]
MKIYQKTISQLRDLIKKKEISPEELVGAFVKRAKKINPKLNAFLTIIDKPEINYRYQDQPLFGIPFSMKDIHLTKGIRTSAGSKILENYIPQYDSTACKKLKSAGAVLIGKTNCDAWGHGASTENSDFGPTKNPWNLAYAPGGSCGGSG